MDNVIQTLKSEKTQITSFWLPNDAKRKGYSNHNPPIKRKKSCLR